MNSNITKKIFIMRNEQNKQEKENCVPLVFFILLIKAISFGVSVHNQLFLQNTYWGCMHVSAFSAHFVHVNLAAKVSS